MKEDDVVKVQAPARANRPLSPRPCLPLVLPGALSVPLPRPQIAHLLIGQGCRLSDRPAVLRARALRQYRRGARLRSSAPPARSPTPTRRPEERPRDRRSRRKFRTLRQSASRGSSASRMANYGNSGNRGRGACRASAYSLARPYHFLSQSSRTSSQSSVSKSSSGFENARRSGTCARRGRAPALLTHHHHRDSTSPSKKPVVERGQRNRPTEVGARGRRSPCSCAFGERHSAERPPHRRDLVEEWDYGAERAGARADGGTRADGGAHAARRGLGVDGVERSVITRLAVCCSQCSAPPSCPP